MRNVDTARKKQCTHTKFMGLDTISLLMRLPFLGEVLGEAGFCTGPGLVGDWGICSYLGPATSDS